ncbi:MAG TPA: HAD-IA family hydrolase [Candidatus Limnocylindria bacterium]|nr:HAD-IA family hydrolase [Candidatus Limnocylindria bacterium]
MITDVDAVLLDPFLMNNNVRVLFDEIVISSEVKCTKPQKQIFEIMVQKLRVEPSEIIFIDNSAINTEAAAKLGMASILYTKNDLLQERLHSLLTSSSASTTTLPPR